MEKQERGLTKYFSLISLVLIPVILMLGMLLFAMNFGQTKRSKHSVLASFCFFLVTI
ncbi:MULTISPECIES: hypothetical protein [Priestia]|uniref:hypothetical protein n=1 Tax=Priestia TaxID=2800373 RepID=UPI001C8EB44B|nr:MULTISPECIES: hypothetical protein [Priestia]MBX9983821.1 hypothetical protein [Priestia aryabhattai]MBY0003537.1 hypothetical protein [Priestia aryabhattai]UYV51516.1 hypothetical protein OHU65_18240 [Priestia megaterium]